MNRAGPTRRSVLATGGVLALAACVPEATAPVPTRQSRVRAGIADEVGELVRLYAAVVTRFPAERADLDPLAAEHMAHLRALVGAAATPSSRAGTPPPVPGTPVEARASLAVAERAAAGRRRHEALRAGPDLARLLASVAACNETHAALLGRA